MAGSYPDVPSRRMAWDEDGTIAINNGFRSTNATRYTSYRPVSRIPIFEEETTEKAKANSENDTTYLLFRAVDAPSVDGGTSDDVVVGILFFPELRELDGAYVNIGNDNATVEEAFLYSSDDTTDGQNGTWTQELSAGSFLIAAAANPIDTYRSGTYLNSLARSNVRAVTIWVVGHSIETPGIRALHVYGEISPGQTPDRILFLDPNNSDIEYGKPVDWGDVAPDGTLLDKIKLQNNSSSLVAHDVVLTREALYESSDGWYTFSEDDYTYDTSLTIDSLGPGQTKTIWVRQTIPAAEATGLHAARYQALVTSWT